MKLAIMQPYVFPYIGYFQLINSVDKFVFYDDVNFIKQGWINRNNIILNNKKHQFNIPIKNVSSFRKICDTEIDNKFNWRRKLLLTLEQSYKRAPFFSRIQPMLVDILSNNDSYISHLATSSTLKILNYLGIQTVIGESSMIYKNDDLKGEARILDICKKEGSIHYINPIGGQELYHKETFANHGIKLNFLKSKNTEYKQYDNTYIPGLSIIDVLMFNDKEEIKQMLATYELI